jgi:hypothetical protein
LAGVDADHRRAPEAATQGDRHPLAKEPSVEDRDLTSMPPVSTGLPPWPDFLARLTGAGRID